MSRHMVTFIYCSHLAGTRVYTFPISVPVNYFFFGFGTGVPFELAVVRGVGVEPVGGALGACGVLCGLLGCIAQGIASVSGNVEIFTETDKPERKTWLSRRGWRGFCFHLVRLTFSSQQQESVNKTHGAACSIE